MDTGLPQQLEAVLARHPGVTIRVNLETARWEAIEFPTETCEVLTHAPTLAELDIKLSPDEPTLDDLRRQHPHWIFFTGVNHCPYGRLPLTSPPVVLMGEDVADLRDQVNGYLGRS